MQAQMTTELHWLVLTTLMTGLFWVPYILNRLLEQGIFPAIYDPHGDTTTKFPWAQRMMKAHENAVENLVIFAPLVLALHVSGMSTSVTTSACAIYFFTRLTHYIVFTLAIPVLRVVTFLIGAGAQVTLALTLLGII